MRRTLAVLAFATLLVQGVWAQQFNWKKHGGRR